MRSSATGPCASRNGSVWSALGGPFYSTVLPSGSLTQIAGADAFGTEELDGGIDVLHPDRVEMGVEGVEVERFDSRREVIHVPGLGSGCGPTHLAEAAVQPRSRRWFVRTMSIITGRPLLTHARSSRKNWSSTHIDEGSETISPSSTALPIGRPVAATRVIIPGKNAPSRARLPANCARSERRSDTA